MEKEGEGKRETKGWLILLFIVLVTWMVRGYSDILRFRNGVISLFCFLTNLFLFTLFQRSLCSWRKNVHWRALISCPLIQLPCCNRLSYCFSVCFFSWLEKCNRWKEEEGGEGGDASMFEKEKKWWWQKRNSRQDPFSIRRLSAVGTR